jgi:hypothetical protein
MRLFCLQVRQTATFVLLFLPGFFFLPSQGCCLPGLTKGVPMTATFFYWRRPRCRSPPSLNLKTFYIFKFKFSEVMMKTTYLVWKDPSCGGITPDWQEITGKEFYALVNTDEGKQRRFVRLFSTELDGSDGELVMEATAEEYRKWKKDKRHSEYLRDINPGYKEVSYHAMESEDGTFGEELLRDEDSDVESVYFGRVELQTVKEAIVRLSDDERKLVEYFFLSAEQGTERGYSALTGIPYMTVHDRKIRVMNKLKNFLQS